MMKKQALGKVTAGLVSLLLAACNSGTGSGGNVTPQQGFVQFVHGDYQLAGSSVQFALDNMDAGNQAYGQGSAYAPFAPGAHTLRSSAGGVTSTTSVTLYGDAHYTFFASPGSTASSLGGRFVGDDLSKPSAGLSNIRFINLLANAGANVELAQQAAGSSAYQQLAYDDEAFTSFTPGIVTLAVRDGSGQVLGQVGTGARKYESGHIYTVLAVGDATATSADARPKFFLLVNL